NLRDRATAIQAEENRWLRRLREGGGAGRAVRACAAARLEAQRGRARRIERTIKSETLIVKAAVAGQQGDPEDVGIGREFENLALVGTTRAKSLRRVVGNELLCRRNSGIRRMGRTDHIPRGFRLRKKVA